MRILIAEDDRISRLLLETSLKRWGHEVIQAIDGHQAWQRLQAEDSPEFAIVDWMMPEMDGLEVCRRARRLPRVRPLYIILLTARGQREDVVAGLDAGADDYVTKPFDAAELCARVQAGVRIVDLQHALADHIHDLEIALKNVKQLQGLLPICSYCRNIRNDQNYWQRVEDYISAHSQARFSHGICPECYRKMVEPELTRLAPEEDIAL